MVKSLKKQKNRSAAASICATSRGTCNNNSRNNRRRRDHSQSTKHGIFCVFLISFGLTYLSLTKIGQIFPADWNGDGAPAADLPQQFRNVLPSSSQFRKLEEEVNQTYQTLSEELGRWEASAEETYRSWSSYLQNNLTTSSSYYYSSLMEQYWPQNSIISSGNVQNSPKKYQHDDSLQMPGSKIPTWLHEYFQWHQQVKSQLTKDNWKDHRYLVMTCLKGMNCGGITDRLRPVLAMLRVAHMTNRILLVYWERPFPLEEFLVPPQGGLLDWRVPSFIQPELNTNTMTPTGHWKRIANTKDERTILVTQYQSWNYGWLWYDEQGKDKGELSAIEVFKDVWNSVFVPSPPVQAMIDSNRQELGLVPGEFATAHIRALWTIKSRTLKETTVMVKNAMNCASHLRPGGPFLVTSDHLEALSEAQKYGAEKGVQVITPSYDREPLHVGMHNESDTSVTPQDFYSAFVDIYLIAMTRCVAVGPGGYGYWGQILGYNHTCWIRHSGEKARKCTWKASDDDNNGSISGNKKMRKPSLPTRSTEATVNIKKEENPSPEPCIVNGTLPCVVNNTIQMSTKLQSNPQENLWDQSSMIPDWLKQYFQWHKETRAQLTPENYKNHRYMVMSCFRGTKCGGMTDRLRPILAELRVAYNSSRLFFIHWERPFPLEEYLLPPEGGLDWRLPPFLLPGVRDTQYTGVLKMRFYGNPEPMFVTTTYQSWHYGELIYNEALLPGEPDAQTVFRDVWNTVFTPAPPIADMIYHSFEQMGITPGRYATAHIRALYSLDDRDAREMLVMVRNAMNCVSNLRPGGPFFVTADSALAVEMALEYGKQKNATVVATPHQKQPLHLGLHNESDTSIVAADFYDVFSDMYLIAETNCMVVGPGGYGRWGILLGHNRTCNKFSSGFKAESCDWKDPPPGTTPVDIIPQQQLGSSIPQYRQPMQ